MRRQAPSAFTLVELIIVIGVIVLLVAILLPVIGKAREQAWFVQCQNNERQILLAMFMYAQDNREVLPMPGYYDGQASAIWMVGHGTPTGEVRGLYDYRNGAMWPYTGEKDPQARQRLFICPMDYEPRTFNAQIGEASPTNNRGDFGPRNFSYNFNYELYEEAAPVVIEFTAGVKLSRIKGAARKILVVEPDSPAGEYTNFYTYMVQGPGEAQNPTLNPVVRRHQNGANMGMADGHVELFPADFFRPQPGFAPGKMPDHFTGNSAQYNEYIALPH